MKVVTFGELMLRLSPPGFERFLQSPVLAASFGGGEANVAVSLAHFGVESHFVTALPRHAIGDAAVRALRAEGVCTDHIVRRGERIGIYFAETGASQRPSSVIYDRTGSAISQMPPDAVPWDEVLRGAGWFHATGITPALGPAAAAATGAAIDAARRAGARVSLDLNYRRKLWTEQQAQDTMRRLVRNVDLVIANEEDLQAALGISVPGANVAGAALDIESYRAAAACVSREFGVSQVAITLRESLSASENGWSGLLWDATSATLHTSQRYLVRIVDRIGGGDSFAAGFIYSTMTAHPPDEALRFAVAASALKHTIPGDFNRVTVAEVQALAAGDASGRVQR
jgi:2-dehydro-3-deoxygluconokinase